MKTPGKYASLTLIITTLLTLSIWILTFRKTYIVPSDIYLDSSHFKHIRSWLTETEKQQNRSKWQVNETYLTKTCSETILQKVSNKTTAFCPCYTDKNIGYIKPDFTPPAWNEMSKKFKSFGVQNGGHYVPQNCQPRQKVAVNIMYRDRPAHLQILINHLHNVLIKQGMEYQIFVVEQAYPDLFNKAALFNIGFLESSKIFPFDCYIAQDVDTLIEDDRCLYACGNQPRHLAYYIDKVKYEKVGKYGVKNVGGVLALTRDMFIKVNGYPTNYWGWGGEDHDMRYRLNTILGNFSYQDVSVDRFSMIKHESDKKNPAFGEKYEIWRHKLRNFEKYVQEDGLSNTRYKVYSIQKAPLFTWIFAEPLSVLSNFTSFSGRCSNDVYEQANIHNKTIIRCAEHCMEDEDCTMFSFQYEGAKHWCNTKLKSCDVTDATDSYVYFKGRMAFTKN